MSKVEEITHIGQLKPDPRNPRKHTPSNIGMISDALAEVGAARSIVIDEDAVILAGNGVVEAAGERGIERVRVVQADGNEIIAVQRIGLSEEQKRRLALFDNRSGELAEYEADVLRELSDLGLTKGIFPEDELEGLFEAQALEDLLGTQLDKELTGNASEQAEKKKREIRPVLFADGVAVFEAALEATGNPDRGEALLEVCRAFLVSK